MNARILERGNGFPVAGDYVTDGNELYLIETINSRIHTGGSGEANYVYAEVALADWDDCEEDEIHTASVIVGR